MAQADLNVANASGASFRQDINNQLLALGTLQSGASAPSTTYAYMLWADTANDLLKVRNSGNSGWIEVGTLSLENWGFGRLRLETTQLTTSGTSIDFTGIPSWAKRITLSLTAVSTTGTSNVVLRLGDSGGIETNNYLGASTFVGPSTNIGSYAHSSTTGFNFLGTTPSANTVDFHGSLTLTLIEASSNTWSCMGNLARTDVIQVNQIAGSKALSATLDRIRITTVGGTDTFDAGKANILYEG